MAQSSNSFSDFFSGLSQEQQIVFQQLFASSQSDDVSHGSGLDVDDNTEAIITDTENSDSHGDAQLSDHLEETAAPEWITKLYYTDKTFGNVYFNPLKFDVKSFAGLLFNSWYDEELSTTDWTSFVKCTSMLVNNCADQLLTFFSRNETRKMHSTERHQLSAYVAFVYPSLMAKFGEFQQQHYQGDDLKREVYKTTFNTPTFMSYFKDKLSRRLDYKTEDKKLQKPTLSNKMKLHSKEHPRRVKKSKSNSGAPVTET